MIGDIFKLLIAKKIFDFISNIFSEKEVIEVEVEKEGSSSYETRTIKEKSLLRQEVAEIFEEKPKEKEFFIEPYKIYSVNVCGIYVFSKRDILLTGSENKLLIKTKRQKYRPIVIYNIRKENKSVQFFALSTDYSAYRKKFIKFDLKYCKFQREKCFIPKFPPKDLDKAQSIIFYRSVDRKGNYRKNQSALFSTSLRVLENMFNYENLNYYKKQEAKQICEFNREDYKIILECADCKPSYVKQIVDQIKKGNKKNGRKRKNKRRSN